MASQRVPCVGRCSVALISGLREALEAQYMWCGPVLTGRAERTERPTRACCFQPRVEPCRLLGARRSPILSPRPESAVCPCSLTERLSLFRSGRRKASFPLIPKDLRLLTPARRPACSTPADTAAFATTHVPTCSAPMLAAPWWSPASSICFCCDRSAGCPGCGTQEVLWVRKLPARGEIG